MWEASDGTIQQHWDEEDHDDEVLSFESSCVSDSDVEIDTDPASAPAPTGPSATTTTTARTAAAHTSASRPGPALLTSFPVVPATFCITKSSGNCWDSRLR